MRILLVDASSAEAQSTAGVFRQCGHTVTIVDSGARAIEHYSGQSPDLVVAHAGVAGIDALALSQTIRASAAPRWQPIIFVADEHDLPGLMRALEIGVDAVLVKPISPAALAARLAVIEQLLKLQRDAEVRSIQLGRYLAAEAEDLRIARHLIEHQLAGDNPHRLEDPAVQHWHQRCAELGGDMLSCCRAPNGVLHAMLADARGSGLAAYVSLLPIIAPFYRMTEKGFPLATIVRELNLKVRQVLPENRAVAVQLVAVDPREGIVSLWNGDMPAACMLDGFGRHFQEFSLSHPALGVVADEQFDDRVEQHAFTRGEQLVMVSDGLLDAPGTDGTRFGAQGLSAALLGLPRSQRLAEAAAAVHVHLAGRAPADDISLVLIDCEQEAASPTVQPQKSAQSRHPGSWRFSLCLGANELCHLDVVPLLLNVTGQFDTTRERGGELFVILSELFNNALDHGVLRLDSRLKLSPDGMEAWLRMREECLSVLDAGEIKLSVEQVVEAGQVWLRIRCRDSGPGFDVGATILQADAQRSGMPSVLPYGRGLALVRHIAHTVDFNDAGNEVTVLLALDDALLPPG